MTHRLKYTELLFLGGLALFLAYSAGMGAIVMAVSLGAALFKGAVQVRETA